MAKEFPIAIRDVSPGPNAVRLTGQRLGGGSDGLHTGGAWLFENKVWKPLDGRPYGNAQIHIETREEEVLEALKGKPLFPKNWEVKVANGRRFLVRDKVPTFPNGSLHLTLKDLREVEAGIIEMNNNHWEVNDDIVIGRDFANRFFVIDLSAANKMTGSSPATKADDRFQIEKLYTHAGFHDVLKLRKVGRELAVQVLFSKEFEEMNLIGRDYRVIYSSDREIRTPIKDSISLTPLLPKLRSDIKQIASSQHWIATKKQLPESEVRRFNLTLQHSREGLL